MKYVQVRMADVVTEGPQAGRFSFSFEPDITELSHSVKADGLVNPPILRRGACGFDVVCGYKRTLACKHNGLSEIPALVYETGELPDERCLWLSLMDTTWSRCMSPVEQAIALRKFSEHGYDRDRLAKEIAPKLGLPPSQQYVENCLRILSLDREILLAVHDGSFGVEQAFCLHNLEENSRLPVFHILQSCRANLNETRELVSLIPDIAAMKDIPVRSFIDAEIVSIVGDGSLSPRKKLERLRKHLVSQRYPRLTLAESRFAAIVREMELGESCRISPPKYFEGDDISIAVKAESAEQLARILQKLSSPDAEQRFEKLFSIIRGRGAS